MRIPREGRESVSEIIDMRAFCEALYCAYAPTDAFTIGPDARIAFRAKVTENGRATERHVEFLAVHSLTRQREQPASWRPGDRLELSVIELERPPARSGGCGSIPGISRRSSSAVRACASTGRRSVAWAAGCRTSCRGAALANEAPKLTRENFNGSCRHRSLEFSVRQALGEVRYRVDAATLLHEDFAPPTGLGQANAAP